VKFVFPRGTSREGEEGRSQERQRGDGAGQGDRF